MLKKVFLIIFIAFIIIFCGCSQSDKLEIWSYYDDFNGNDILGTIIEGYYRDAFPDTVLNYSITSAEQFPKRIDPVLETGRGVPDVFAIDSAFIRKHAESGHLLDLTDIYERNKSKLLTYPAEIGSYRGKVYAISLQASPGAMFYRRSLALKYFGTEDPKIIQFYFENFDNFLNSARIIKTRSDNACVVVSSLDDIQLPFFSARQNPWIVNNKLVIDPVMEQYFDIAKEMHDNNWAGKVNQWSEGWYLGMKGELKNENGNQLEVFSYFLPAWGLQNILENRAGDTVGDWAMIQGPAAYYWGGTWIGAWKKTKNSKTALQMIEWLVSDEDFLAEYVNDTEEFISNIEVMNNIKSDYKNPFLGGQNHYEYFTEISKAVNSRIVQETDAIIQQYFIKALNSYISGAKSKEEAMEDFKKMVKEELNIE